MFWGATVGICNKQEERSMTNDQREYLMGLIAFDLSVAGAWSGPNSLLHGAIPIIMERVRQNAKRLGVPDIY